MQNMRFFCCSVYNNMKSPEKIGLYRGSTGKVRMQFVFYEMYPDASRYQDAPWLHRYSQNEA